MNFLFSGPFWGILLILWGLSIILKSFFPALKFSFVTIFVSIVLIVFGIQLLMLNFGRKSSGYQHKSKRVMSESYQTGNVNELNVVFSTDSLNLKSVDITDSDRYVTISAVFGKAVVYVSKDTPLRLESNSVFGQVHKDSRIRIAQESENALIIDANAVFGTIDIIVLDK